MGNSWGHTLERLSAARLAGLAASLEHDGYDYGRCAIGRLTHTNRATYEATYNYVTGRGGRVSFARKRICDEHAAKFAAKHGIDFAAVPTQVERPKHASEELIEQFLSQPAIPEGR